MLRAAPLRFYTIVALQEYFDGARGERTPKRGMSNGKDGTSIAADRKPVR